MNNAKSWQGNSMLLIAAAVWGGGFVAQRMGLDHVGPFTYNACRFPVGALCLLAYHILIHRRQVKTPVPVHSLIKPVLICGSCMFMGASFQQYGLKYTTASNAGFVTGLYVIFVPLIGILLGHKNGVSVWLGCILAVSGMYLLSVSESMTINLGDALVFISALFWSFHVLSIGHFASRIDPIRFAIGQLVVCTLGSGIVAALTEPITWPSIQLASGAIIYGGVFSVGLGFTLQVFGQRNATPAAAAIILSLESVFAALFGVLFLHEVLSPRALTGCALMLSGMIFAQLDGFRSK